MNRLVRGSVLLAVAAWACGGDPTANNAAQPDQLIANPSVVFIANTDSQAVLVDLFNSLGQQLGADFTLGTVGSGIVVTRDTTYRHLAGQPPVNTEAQFIVRPMTPDSFVTSSFTVTAGGKTVTVPVKITATTLAATFSTTTPNVGDTVTATTPALFTFSSNSQVSFGAGAAAVAGIVTGISPDSTSLSFLLPPGTTTPPVFTGVTLPYLTFPQTVPATTAVVPTTTTTFIGTDDPATAPSIVVAPSGGASSIFDIAAFTGADITGDGGFGAQFYTVTLAAPATLDISLNWNGGADLDLVLCSDVACVGEDFQAATASQPEKGIYTLAPGTYYIAAVYFAGTQPAWIKITVATE